MLMNLFGRFLKKQKEEPAIMPELKEIDGRIDVRKSLATYSITHRFVLLPDLLSYDNVSMLSEELNVPSKVVRDDLTKLTKGMVGNLTVCIEYPYVDEYYRDTYYSFYARKHSGYNRYCFRLSFFQDEDGITEANFYNKKLDDSYMGYCILRPTPRRVIGYTFLSPRIYKENNFSICLCERSSFIKGRRVMTYAFPFSGQDGEMNTCAETCVTMMFDYFSRRYNKYARVLPSQIASQLTDCFLDRKQPSVGVDVDTIATIMNVFNLNTRQYYKALSEDDVKGSHYSKDDFKRLLHIYIESGFPLYVVTQQHAMLAIGRQNRLFHYSPKIVVVNDEKKPYWQLQNEDDILSFIVPVPENILLNVDVLNPTKDLEILSRDYPVADIHVNDADYYNRVYLTTSRSYKSYIVDSSLNAQNKDLIVSAAMPKFIWVCESIKKSDLSKSIQDIKLSNIAIFDSTDYPSEYNHIIVVKSKTKLLVPYDDRTHMRKRFYRVSDSKEVLTPFTNNLKGFVDNWKI